MVEPISREYEDRFHTVFHSTSDGMLIVDDGWRIKQVNSAAQVMLDCAPNQLVDKLMTDVMLPRDLPEAVSCFQRLLRGSPDQCRYGSHFMKVPRP